MSAVDEAAVLAGPELHAFMARVEQHLQASAGWSRGAAGAAAAHTLAAGGKRLRPLLVLLCAPDPKRGHDGLARAACAVELVHSATLVHDDVLDRAPLRRGLPTVWAQGGDETAVATGDYLFARAFAVLAEAGDAVALDELARASQALALGEALQMEQARRPQTTAQQYLERCALKTGRLFAAACALGGRFGGLDEAAGEALRTYGRCLGLAFQIADDVLDCAGHPDATGKPLGTDLLDGTATLPLVLAAGRDAAVAAAIATRPPAGDVLELLQRVAATGALAEAREIALDFARRAEAALDDLDDELDIRPLRAIARRVVDRET